MKGSATQGSGLCFILYTWFGLADSSVTTSLPAVPDERRRRRRRQKESVCFSFSAWRIEGIAMGLSQLLLCASKLELETGVFSPPPTDLLAKKKGKKIKSQSHKKTFSLVEFSSRGRRSSLLWVQALFVQLSLNYNPTCNVSEVIYSSVGDQWSHTAKWWGSVRSATS